MTVTKLKWLAPDDAFRWVINDATFDDEPVRDIIAQAEAIIAFESRAFNLSGAHIKDQPAFRAQIEPLEKRISRCISGVQGLFRQLLEAGSWIGCGRRSREGLIELIPARYWAYLTLDIGNRCATDGNGLEYRSIAFIRTADVPLDHPTRAAFERVNRLEHVEGQRGVIHNLRGAAEEVRWTEERPQPVSDIAFHQFMKAHTDKMQPGDRGLIESELVAAANKRFGDQIPRARVRKWIRSHLPYAKRTGIGRKPRRSGDLK